MSLKLVLQPYKPSMANVKSDAIRLDREASVILVVLGHIQATCEPTVHPYLCLVQKYATEIVHYTHEVMQMDGDAIEKEAIRLNKEMVENMTKMKICIELHEIIFNDLKRRRVGEKIRNVLWMLAITVVLLGLFFFLWR